MPTLSPGQSAGRSVSVLKQLREKARAAEAEEAQERGEEEELSDDSELEPFVRHAPSMIDISPTDRIESNEDHAEGESPAPLPAGGVQPQASTKEDKKDPMKDSMAKEVELLLDSDDENQKTTSTATAATTSSKGTFQARYTAVFAMGKLKGTKHTCVHAHA